MFLATAINESSLSEKTPHLIMTCKTLLVHFGDFCIPAFGRFAIEIAGSDIKHHQAVNIVSDSGVFGMTIAKTESAVIMSPKRSANVSVACRTSNVSNLLRLGVIADQAEMLGGSVREQVPH